MKKKKKHKRKVIEEPNDEKAKKPKLTFTVKRSDIIGENDKTPLSSPIQIVEDESEEESNKKRKRTQSPKKGKTNPKSPKTNEKEDAKVEKRIKDFDYALFQTKSKLTKKRIEEYIREFPRRLKPYAGKTFSSWVRREDDGICQCGIDIASAWYGDLCSPCSQSKGKVSKNQKTSKKEPYDEMESKGNSFFF